ncbi:hypothetical protein [Mycobacterium sp. SMC-4]|uniref:hypothetical protein n=1 Tax=Mycobacterium sp. SMC-4 TaxID=2857059 RepID=UPI0021B194F7|nr:hypothetical protein [Mycobacterium sp. SMC-4]UXA19562.1 hypothetical protein KXD98_08170 [Mycobacterium sp. SMC-4]
MTTPELKHNWRPGEKYSAEAANAVAANINRINGMIYRGELIPSSEMVTPLVVAALALLAGPAVADEAQQAVASAAAELTISVISPSPGTMQVTVGGVPTGEAFDFNVLAIENLVGNYEPEAISLFDRMDVRPNFDRRHAINRLIKDLKDYNLWSRLDGLYVFAAHTAQAGLLNWRRDAANMTALNSPTFTEDRGFTGDGVSSSLWNTSAATVNTQATDAATSLWVSQAASTKDTVFDLWWTNWGMSIDSARTSTQMGWRGANQTTRAVTSLDVGLFSVAQTGPEMARAYRDGAQIDSFTGAYDDTLSFAPASPIRILSQNGSTSFTNPRVSFASYGAGMSPAEMALFYNAVNTYMTAVGVV